MIYNTYFFVIIIIIYKGRRKYVIKGVSIAGAITRFG